MTPLTFLFVFCVAAVPYSVAVLNSEKCNKGPAVWCHNFTTAAPCNAVAHCVQTVWSTEITVQDDDSCQSCTAKVDVIRHNVNSNMTKELLEQLLDTICDLTLISKIFFKTCENAIHEYVDIYLDQLLDLLDSTIDSQGICRILGFCDMIKASIADAYPSLIATEQPTPENDEEAVVRFGNVVLHLPVSYLRVGDIPKPAHIVGSQKCTWGPSYWCNNIQSAKECRTTYHCVKDVWNQQKYDDDNDDVCKICKDMVQQARDQLQSNETQQELRQVFEGSCKLIPIKDIRVECIKLADEFVPELTEMLVSEMNPTAICTVAGLCNSARIDAMLAQSPALIPVNDSCVNCTAAVTAVERYLHSNPREVILGKLLRICGELSSYSDACSALAISRFDDIYSSLLSEVKASPVCHLNGMCMHKYHLHGNENTLAFNSSVDALLTSKNDDLPCDLCQQLVKHFRDVLTANTTEEEFLEVLKGMCEQTGKFKDDCLEIVENNFRIIFKFLTEELDPAQFCKEVGLCPRKNFVSDANLNLITGSQVRKFEKCLKKLEGLRTIGEKL